MPTPRSSSRPSAGRVMRLTLLLALALAACDQSGSGAKPKPGGDRPANGLVSVDERAISGRLEDDELVVTIPVERVGARSVETELNLELLEVTGGEPLERTKLSVALDGSARGDFEARLPLPRSIAGHSDLVRFNLRLHDGTEGGLLIRRSAFATVPRYEVRLEGPARVSSEKTVSYRVRAHDPQSFRAIPDAAVNLVLKRGGQEVRSLSAKTDAHGDAFFDLTLAEAGEYEASASAETAGLQARLSEPLVVETGNSRLLLTTDKPIYQPGQQVHLRALSLKKGSNEPVANAPVRFEILDGKGNKIFKRELSSDAYGIASATFRLGTVLNLGTFQVHAVAGELDVQKTFEVSRYVLPKFAIDVDLDKPWYRAAETVRGKLDARYFFGKDVVAADVEITAATFDVGENTFARLLGKTASDGTFSFEVTLPNSLVGLPLEQGKARVALHVKITDAAGQVVEKDVSVSVAAQDASVVVVPEGTALIPNVPNLMHVFVSDPGGAAVGDAEVTLSNGQTSLTARTDAFGQATLELTPADAPEVHATVTLPSGATLSQHFSFAVQEGDEHVVVRSNRAVYDVGDTAVIEIAASDDGNVYVDWLHEGQAVDQRTLVAKDRRARFEVALDTSLAGNNRVEAYVVDAGGHLVRAGSTLFVREGGALAIDVSSSKPQYEPGEAAELTFSIQDETGKPKVAALGVQIVDEAVFGLVAAKPGLLRTYFDLDDAFAEPHYQIGAPAGSIPSLLFEDTRGADEAKKQAAQQRARATFAALGDMAVTGIHAGSWQGTVAELKKLLAPAYDSELKRLTARCEQLAKDGERWLALRGCTEASGYCEYANGYFGEALLTYIKGHLSAYDLWGSPYTLQEGWDALNLSSAGPDEVSGTDDDGSVRIQLANISHVAHPEAAGDDGFNGAPGAGDGDGDSNGDGDGDGLAVVDAGTAPPGGDGAPRVRRDFPETLYVNPAIITGPDGTAKIEVPLADSITEWRISTLANAPDGRLGGATHGITVFQDFFADIAFPAELTRGDEVSFPIALYNYLDEPQTVTVSLKSAPWYTALGGTSATVELAANAVQGVSFPVRVNDVGLHTLTVQALGKARSDAVERAVRVVPDGKAFPSAQSGALAAGSTTLSLSYPNNAVPGSGALSLDVYPAFLSSVVSGMDSMLQEPYGCFEQTTSTTWPNVLVLRYMHDTKQLTPEIALKAESLISAGYQRLLTFEHPGGGFSWFGTQDAAPYLSVTAFGVMEFADMAAVYDVDGAMLARTIDWLVAQQASDGTWEGDQTEFFSFHTSKVRNTAFVIWALSSAGYQGTALTQGLGYLRAHWDDEAQDGYTLALVANAFAQTSPADSTLDAVLAALGALQHEQGEQISWDAGDTQTSFYGYGNDAKITTTALVAHALLTVGGYPELVKGAIETLLASRDSQGNFGSTQATIWSLRTLLLAASKGTEGAVGSLTVSVDGASFTTLSLTADQADVLTTIDLSTLATTGVHEVLLSFAGSGKVSYNLVSSYHVPWSEVPVEPDGPLAVSVRYDRTALAVNDTVQATVDVANQSGATANMILVDVGIPPGFTVETEDLDAYLKARALSRYEVTPRQLILYLSELEIGAVAEFVYRLRASMPVKASDGGAKVYPYYEPDRKSAAPATTLEALES